MDSFIKTEDFDFSSDSPIYDFSAGFEAMPGAFMPDHDSSAMYGYGTSSPTSGGSSPTYSMSVDSNYPPPPQLSNNHRHPRFLNRNAWAGPDPSQRQPMPGPARPYGAPVRPRTLSTLSPLFFLVLPMPRTYSTFDRLGIKVNGISRLVLRPSRATLRLTKRAVSNFP